MKKMIVFMAMLIVVSGCASQLQVISETEPASVTESDKSDDFQNLSNLDSESAKQLIADAIESDIRQETANSAMSSSSREKDTVIVLLRGEYTFEENSSKLTPQISSEIVRIARILKSYPTIAVRIEGHTDNTGAEWYNLKLSRLRAEVVKSIFIKNGFSDSQISVAPFGESYPIASNSTAEGRMMNRRVVIRVQPAIE